MLTRYFFSAESIAAACPSPNSPLCRFSLRRAGTLDAAAKLWAEGGAKRFTAGLTPCLARAFPANAAGFMIYELVKQAME